MRIIFDFLTFCLLHLIVVLVCYCCLMKLSRIQQLKATVVCDCCQWLTAGVQGRELIWVVSGGGGVSHPPGTRTLGWTCAFVAMVET